jgi:hypothetical protein
MFFATSAGCMFLSEHETAAASGADVDKIQFSSLSNEKLFNYAKDMRYLAMDFISSLENYRDNLESQYLRDDFTDIVNIFKDEYSKAVAPYNDIFVSTAGLEEK